MLKKLLAKTISVSEHNFATSQTQMVCLSCSLPSRRWYSTFLLLAARVEAHGPAITWELVGKAAGQAAPPILNRNPHVRSSQETQCARTAEDCGSENYGSLLLLLCHLSGPRKPKTSYFCTPWERFIRIASCSCILRITLQPRYYHLCRSHEDTEACRLGIWPEAAQLVSSSDGRGTRPGLAVSKPWTPSTQGLKCSARRS